MVSREKAIFLDRDGTINVDNGYVSKIEDFEFIPNSKKALKKLKEAGYKLILVFGQSGINRKKYSKKELENLMNYVFKELKNEGVDVDAWDYCPHRPEDKCECRKPKTLLVEKMIKRFNLDPKNCWNIGDKTSDIKMGEIVGCKNILVKTGKRGEDGECKINPDYIAKDLYDAVNFILEQDKEIILKEVRTH